MYFIRAGDTLLYDPRVDGLKITSPKLDLECNKAGTASFTMYADHPLYNTIIKLKTIITVYRDNELIFRGRVLNDDIAFNKAKKLTCEGELAFFNDSVVRPYTFTGSIKEYLKLLLDSHNSQVDIEKQFRLGNVTVTDPNDYIPRSDATYPNTWAVLEDKLIKSLGGYLIVRHEAEGNYLDYLADSNYISGQTIELGDNLLDLTRVNKGEDIATGIIPLGKAVDDENPDTTDLRLTIASVNGGKDYLIDEQAAAIYGRVFKTVTYDDVTVASNLLTKGKQDLDQSVKTLQIITIKAIDKYMTNIDIAAFRLFEYVKVTSKLHDLAQNLLITKLSIDLEKPSNNTMTTGADVASFINKQTSNINTVKEIEANYVKGEELKPIKKEQKIQSETIEAMPKKIIDQIGENYVENSTFDQYKKDAATELKNLIKDTGWSDLVLSPGVTPYKDDSKNQIRLTNFGVKKQIEIRLDCKGVNKLEDSIVTIASDYAPTEDCNVPIVSLAGTIVNILIEKSGQIKIRNIIEELNADDQISINTIYLI